MSLLTSATLFYTIASANIPEPEPDKLRVARGQIWFYSVPILRCFAALSEYKQIWLCAGMIRVWCLSCRIIGLFATLSFHISVNHIVMSERSQHATSRNEYCEEATVACATEPVSTVVTSLAVVPYDDLKISDFHRAERIFTFGNKRVVIGQNWRDVGVAAVVWDAVMLFCLRSVF